MTWTLTRRFSLHCILESSIITSTYHDNDIYFGFKLNFKGQNCFFMIGLISFKNNSQNKSTEFSR